jgi:hypothetical protein
MTPAFSTNPLRFFENLKRERNGTDSLECSFGGGLGKN